jgi:hypothetical protein
LVTFLSERSNIPIQKIMLLIEVTEQIFTNVPILKGHDLGIQLIFVKLDSRTWVIKDSIVVGPVSNHF